jgi:hypothetical protein
MTTAYQANLYPAGGVNPVVANADDARKSVGVCFSGGGSRALTCAWGQLIGLRGITGGSGKPLLDDVRYISSVSGGTWAAALYTFHADKLSDNEFLGRGYDPSQLHYDKTVPGGLNVSVMGNSALGRIPQNFSNLFELDLLKNIIADFIALTALKGIPLRKSAQWLWMYIVGKNVLADFGLYTYQNHIFKPHETPWNYAGARFFSLSPEYAQRTVFSGAQTPSPQAFVYARTRADGRSACPMLIMNTNIVANDCLDTNMSAPMQIPVQVAPTASGAYGANPCSGETVGGGMTESFGLTSTLSSRIGLNRVAAGFPRAYALADIVSCSSAFFAAILANPMQAILAELLPKKLADVNDDEMRGHLERFSSVFKSAENAVLADIRKHLSALHEDPQNLRFDLGDLVPQYNYWPAGAASQGAGANHPNTEFTDGGNMDNTGVAGLLAQTRGALQNIVAFVNGAEVLEKNANGEIVAATQMAPLFGIAYNDQEGRFKPYQDGGVNPFTHLVDPIGFLKVFDNSGGEFDALRQGLYAANAGGGPAFFQQSLRIVDNRLLGVRAQPAPVKVLWAQNARVDNWQSRIRDTELRQKIEQGQQSKNFKEFAKYEFAHFSQLKDFPDREKLLRSHSLSPEFANFPYYNTFTKIHQTAAETNVLAQMWAWCVGDPASPLRAAIANLFAGASW